MHKLDFHPLSRRGRGAGAAALLVAAVAAGAGCGGGSPGPTGGAPGDAADAAAGCEVTYAGNISATATTAPGCASLTAAPVDGGPDGATLVVSVPATSQSGIQLDARIAVGANPVAGVLSSTDVARWQVSAVVVATYCFYSAGSAAIPTGTFTLTLSSVPGSGDAGAVHGSLHVEQYVHAPQGVDCGSGDIETVDLAF